MITEVKEMIYKCFKNSKRGLIVLSILFGLHSVMTMITPILMKNFMNEITAVRPELKNVYIIIILFAFANGLALLVGYFMNQLEAKLKNNAALYIINFLIETYHDFTNNSSSKFDSNYLSQRIMTDSFQTSSYIIDFLTSMTTALVKSTILVIIIYRISPSTLYYFFSFIPLYLIAILIVKKKYYSNKYNYAEHQNLFFSMLTEIISNMNIIRINSILPNFSKRLSNSYGKYLKTAIKMYESTYLLSNLEMLLSIIFNIFLMYYSAKMVIKGNLKVGDVLLVIIYFNEMMALLRYLNSQYQLYQDFKVSCERISELLASEKTAHGECYIENIRKITIENLSFSYSDLNLFDDLNLELNVGFSYLISGRNGAGKSTFISILLGLQDKYLGSIKFNDYNIKDLNMLKIRKKNFGVLEQNPILFSGLLIDYYNLFLEGEIGSLIENIATELHTIEFNSKFNCNFIIDDQCTNYSGGEKQKIAILRTLIRGSDVLIFDEPDSSLDFSTTNKFYNYIDQIKKNKIVIVISHNELFEKCDFIIHL